MVYQSGIVSPRTLFIEQDQKLDLNKATAMLMRFAHDQKAEVVANSGEQFQHLVLLHDKSRDEGRDMQKAAGKFGVRVEPVSIRSKKAQTVYRHGETLIHTSQYEPGGRGEALARAGFHVISQPNETPHLQSRTPGTKRVVTDIDRTLTGSEIEQVFYGAAGLTHDLGKGPKMAASILAGNGFATTNPTLKQIPGPLMGWMKGSVEIAKRVNGHERAPYTITNEALTARGIGFKPLTEFNFKAHELDLDKTTHKSGQAKTEEQKGASDFYDDGLTHIATAEVGSASLVHNVPDPAEPTRSHLISYIQAGVDALPTMDTSKEIFLTKENLTVVTDWLKQQKVDTSEMASSSWLHPDRAEISRPDASRLPALYGHNSEAIEAAAKYLKRGGPDDTAATAFKRARKAETVSA